MTMTSTNPYADAYDAYWAAGWRGVLRSRLQLSSPQVVALWLAVSGMGALQMVQVRAFGAMSRPFLVSSRRVVVGAKLLSHRPVPLGPGLPLPSERREWSQWPSDHQIPNF
ncbi:MAG: hypothetical protein E6Q97_23570 [Desulfurellales bacterium]|nr:MAG: hypothetical protein E6Q97_23570 [Desulfurellales bacterium]